MNSTLRIILSIILGLVIGSLVNMGLILISGSVIAPPVDADTATIEGLKEALLLFEPKHFIMPFLAHAIGTLAGALVAALLVKNHKLKVALSIGVFFLIGGISNVVMLPSPIWFTVVDITLAYIPMAYLGYKLSKRLH